MNEIPIFHNTKLHENLQLCSIFLLCTKETAVGLLLTASRKPTKSNTFLLQNVGTKR